MNPIQRNWINFKTHFCTAHRELEETVELTMEGAGYHQANLVNNIVTHMSGLPFPYPLQEPECTPTPNRDPTIVPTVQPTPVANVTTDVYYVLPQLLTSMQQMQQLMIRVNMNQKGGGVQTSNHITRTLQAETGSSV